LLRSAISAPLLWTSGWTRVRVALSAVPSKCADGLIDGQLVLPEDEEFYADLYERSRRAQRPQLSSLQPLVRCPVSCKIRNVTNKDMSKLGHGQLFGAMRHGTGLIILYPDINGDNGPAIVGQFRHRDTRVTDTDRIYTPAIAIVRMIDCKNLV
jgi:hypothetical protein